MYVCCTLTSPFSQVTTQHLNFLLEANSSKYEIKQTRPRLISVVYWVRKSKWCHTSLVRNCFGAGVKFCCDFDSLKLRNKTDEKRITSPRYCFHESRFWTAALCNAVLLQNASSFSLTFAIRWSGHVLHLQAIIMYCSLFLASFSAQADRPLHNQSNTKCSWCMLKIDCPPFLEPICYWNLASAQTTNGYCVISFESGRLVIDEQKQVGQRMLSCNLCIDAAWTFVRQISDRSRPRLLVVKRPSTSTKKYTSDRIRSW